MINITSIYLRFNPLFPVSFEQVLIESKRKIRAVGETPPDCTNRVKLGTQYLPLIGPKSRICYFTLDLWYDCTNRVKWGTQHLPLIGPKSRISYFTLDFGWGSIRDFLSNCALKICCIDFNTPPRMANRVKRAPSALDYALRRSQQ